MREKNIEERPESRVGFEQLEEWARGKVQCWLQELLEEEVTELLGRGRSVRREGIDAPRGYRNGYGKPRRLSMSGGTITLRRPRVRDVEERFESRVLPLFAKRSREVRQQSGPQPSVPACHDAAARHPSHPCSRGQPPPG